ncbi:MAG: hypothetical protein KDA58_16975, partial [Planctomycetaceae bacterium]|nr:hypothetical protein [Planctomycetaceae bacterium]
MSLWKHPVESRANNECHIGMGEPSLLERVAMETVGRCGEDFEVDRIISIAFKKPLSTTEDTDEFGAPVDPAKRVAEHALIYAMYERERNAPAMFQGQRTLDILTDRVKSNFGGTQRMALVVLDQLDDGRLTAARVLPFLKHPDVSVSRTAAWVIGHHPEWGPDLVEHFREALAAVEPGAGSEAERERLTEQLARLAQSEAIQQLLAETAGSGAETAQVVALRAMQQSGLAATPSVWLDRVSAMLPQASEPGQLAAVDAIAQWRMPKEGHAELKAALVTVAGNKDSADTLRLKALQVASPLDAVDIALLQTLVTWTQADPELGLRREAVQVLGLAKLQPAQQASLLPLLGELGPLELPLLLPAFRDGEVALGSQLVERLADAPGVKGIRVDQL